MKILTPSARTHGRVLVGGHDAADTAVVVFHGYGQSAEEIFAIAEPVATTLAARLIAIQGLHRFYSRRHERVVASWMTREDRDLAIGDNIDYVDACLDEAAAGVGRIIAMGFSQGASMAYRVAQLGRHIPAAVVAIAGTVPPELLAKAPRPWPPLFVAAGTADTLLPPGQFAADTEALRAVASSLHIETFDGGHEWTAEVGAAVVEWIRRLPAPVSHRVAEPVQNTSDP